MECFVLYITGDVDPDYSVWVSELSAAKHACTLISETIDQDLDLRDAQILYDVKKINELILDGDYLKAVNYWNDCDMSKHYYYTIEGQNIYILADVDEPIINSLVIEEEEKQEENIVCQASSGATCKKCQYYNEYAVADGNYICFGCKGMTAIFGS